MKDDVLASEFEGTSPTTQPRILPPAATSFMRTQPRKPGSQRGLQRNWSVIPGVGYRLDVPDLRVTFDVARMRTKFDEIWGLLTVRAQFAGAKVVADNVLSMGDFSFSSVRSRHERSKELEIRGCAPEIDWRGLIEELSIKVLSHEERGEPEVEMADVALTAKEYEPDMRAAGMPLLKHHPVIWFGDGGAAKSLLALYAAADLAENGWRVLYCDWELTAEEHAQRLLQLIGSTNSIRNHLFYRRCNRPFVDDILPIRDIIAKRRIQFLVCDSLSFGAKSPIESSESALGYQQALRECGPIGSLHIAHINRSEQGDQRPFGSTYWHNMARATWFLKRGENSPYPNEITVGCYNKKANLSGHHPPFAQHIIFSKDKIQVGPGELDSDTDLVDKLNIVEKIKIALRSGPKTENSLADECGGKTTTIGRHIRGNKTLFEKVLSEDGVQRIRLVKNV